jgi:hypothetical protein
MKADPRFCSCGNRLKPAQKKYCSIDCFANAKMGEIDCQGRDQSFLKANRRCYNAEARAIVEGKHWEGKNKCIKLLGDPGYVSDEELTRSWKFFNSLVTEHELLVYYGWPNHREEGTLFERSHKGDIKSSYKKRKVATSPTLKKIQKPKGQKVTVRKMKKIDQITEYVTAHPGSTSYEILKDLGEEFKQPIYYAIRSGKIQAVNDDRFKRILIFYPLESAPACQIISASEGVTQ